MELGTLVDAWQAVAATRSRREKIALLAGCLRSAGSADVAAVTAALTGEPLQGRIGVGPATLAAAGEVAAAAESTLTLREVEDAFTAIAATGGRGSSARRREVLGALFSRATRDEREFLARLLIGELRQGALEAIVAEAIGHATEVPIESVRRALLLSGRLPDVARAAFEGGAAALAKFDLRLFQPLSPMLAGTAADVDDAVARLGEAAFDYKLDGARIQVHRQGGDVRIFTRNLNDVTESLPDLVEAVLRFPGDELVLDGEAIALRRDGRPLPFQVTMRRFGRQRHVERLRHELPLRGLFFDVLRAGGRTLLDRPAVERFDALASLLPPQARVPRIIASDRATAAEFLAEARSAGHEGIIAKSLASPWDAGARGAAWLKVKPSHTLDLVVLGAEWGHGRRRGWLSNLHLGARDADGFVMIGKTFKGLTDAVLEWQTRALLDREVARDGNTVLVRPELVVEVAFNEVQASPRYAAGVTLRFARVRAYRPDKSPAEADTIAAVRALYDFQTGSGDTGPS